MMKEKE